LGVSAPLRQLPAPTPAPKALEGWIPATSHRPAWEALGVRAIDDFTLEAQLERPIPFFLELTQFPMMAPIREDVVVKWATPSERADAARQKKPYLLWVSSAWWRPKKIVTNGPYTLTDWAMNDRFVFEKNPHYWDSAAVKLEKVVSITSDDTHAMLNLYKGGLLDYPGTNTAIPPDFVLPISKKKDYVNAAYLGTYFYWINVHADPVKNIAVRRALNMSINKKAICENVMRGGQKPATALVPPGTGQGYQPPEGDPYDVLRAKQILAEAGFPGGKGLPKITLLYNTEEGHRKIAEAIHQMWKVDLGIDVDIENQEWKVFNKNLENGFYQIGRMGWIGDYNDPFTFLSILLSTSDQNNAKWKNKMFDDLLDKAARERDLTKRYDLYREAEKVILRELPVLPIYTYRRQSLVRPYVRGWAPNILDIHLYKDLWIEPGPKTSPIPG
ncbi:MAG: peptide ABC transporter substrate-binding protein, partial [Deltaproteobacteria bacterium]|nr:peptide ABC transporter substrate-binding protein [Deltaproteobacteria bacterium]